MKITQADQDRYAEMAARFEADDSPVTVDDFERGPEMRAHARQLLLDAAETEEEREHIRSLGGRPALDPASEGGPSPLWTLRAPQNLDTAMRRLAKAQGRPLSAVLRDAATDYLAAHKAG